MRKPVIMVMDAQGGGMVIADSMLGEITPAMACAIARSDAARILIPFAGCDHNIAGVRDFSLAFLIRDAVDQLKKYLTDDAALR